MRCVRLCPFAQSFDHRVLIFCAIDNSETPNACSQSTAIKIHYAASRATGGARSSSSSSTKELSSSICCNLQMPPHRQSLIVFYFLLFVCMNYYYNQVQNGMITRTPQTPIYHSIIDILRMMDFFLPRCRFTNDRSFACSLVCSWLVTVDFWRTDQLKIVICSSAIRYRFELKLHWTIFQASIDLYILCVCHFYSPHTFI